MADIVRTTSVLITRVSVATSRDESFTPRLSVAKLMTMDVSAPPTKPEQFAIAATLSDMDVQPSALEACRDKTRDPNQVLTQGLLTGHTRLV